MGVEDTAEASNRIDYGLDYYMELLKVIRFESDLAELLSFETCVKLRIRIEILTGFNLNVIEAPFSSVFLLGFERDSVKIRVLQGREKLAEVEFCADLNGNKKVFEVRIEKIAGLERIQLCVEVLNSTGLGFAGFGQSEEFRKSVQDIKELIELGGAGEDFESLKEFDLEKTGIDLGFIDKLVIDKQDLQLFNGMWLGLNEKLKILQCIDQIQGQSQLLSQELIKSRAFLQNSLQISTKDMQTLQQDQEHSITEAFKSLNAIKLCLNSQFIITRALENRVTELLSQNKLQESTIKDLQSQVRNFEEQSQMIQELRSRLADLDQERKTLQSQFKDYQSAQDLITQESDQELDKVINENTNLRHSISKLSQEKSLLTDYIAKLDSDIASKNCQIKTLISELNSYKNIENKANQMENLAKANQEISIKTYDQLTSNISKFSEILKDLNLEKVKLLRTSADLQLNISRLEQGNKVLVDKVKADSILSQELKSKNIVSSQSEDINKDCKNITKTLVGLYSDVSKAKQHFITDLNLVLKAYFVLSQGLLILNRCISKVRDFNTEKDFEIIALQETMTVIQKSMPYVPVKDDGVDVALAEYLNNMGSGLLVPFIREDSGIYLFGTKRVCVKLDNGQLSSNPYLVRVGGGAILVDEFIHMYAETELSKLEERSKSRSSPLKSSALSKVVQHAGSS